MKNCVLYIFVLSNEFIQFMRPSCLSSYGSWIYNYR